MVKAVVIELSQCLITMATAVTIKVNSIATRVTIRVNSIATTVAIKVNYSHYSITTAKAVTIKVNYFLPTKASLEEDYSLSLIQI